MASIDGGGMLIRVLKQHGIREIFTLHGQERMYGKERTVATALAPSRYDLSAAGFGCHGEQVEHPAELVPALQRALACGRPACVNVMTNLWHEPAIGGTWPVRRRTQP